MPELMVDSMTVSWAGLPGAKHSHLHASLLVWGYFPEMHHTKHVLSDCPKNVEPDFLVFGRVSTLAFMIFLKSKSVAHLL